MNFLEKDLETIIYENYAACYERGLDISQIGEYLGETRYRQPNLAPYGIADLVNIRYSPSEYELTIQVIECKKDEINLATYTQAQRYVTAIKAILKAAFGIGENTINIIVELILVGRKFEPGNEFAYIYNADTRCQAFTYTYAVDGIRFTQVPRGWGKELAGNEGAHSAFVEAFRDEMQDRHNADEETQLAEAEEALMHGNRASPLLVTSSGVLLNIDLLERDNRYANRF